MFFKIGVLKNLALFTGKRLCWSLFLIKLQAFKCFSVNIAKLLGAAFFYRTPPVAASSDVLVYIIFSIRSCWIYCSFNCIIVSFWNKNLSHLLSFVVPLVVRFLSLSFIASLCHWLSLAVPLVVTHCSNRCHSLSLVVPLDVIRCTTRCHSMYNSSVFL